jgi:NADPH-dependent glutamate synthase beta subunit-like oxidoreductase
VKIVLPGTVYAYAGLYCSGWVKRGPIGVIASTMNDAFDTAKTLVDDLPSLTASTAKPGSKAILPVLAERGVYV